MQGPPGGHPRSRELRCLPLFVPTFAASACFTSPQEEAGERGVGSPRRGALPRRLVIWWHLGSAVLIKQVAFAHRHVPIQFISWRDPGEPYLVFT